MLDSSYKVLYCGVFNPLMIHQASPISNDDVICRGLEANGCEVMKFDYRQEAREFGVDKMREVFYLKAVIEKPDIIWFGKTNLIGVELLLNLKSVLPKTKFVDWADDIRPEPVEDLIEFNKYTDLLMADFGGDWLKKHKDLGVNRICNFLTILDTDNYYKTIVDSPWWEDVLFTGKVAPFSDDVRIETQRILKLAGYKIYDEKDWIGYPDYLFAINGAKIGIGVNSINHAELYTSDRLAHFTGCGTFYMTYRIKGLEKVFSEDEIVQFDSIKDLEEKILYYLKNEEEREFIAKNGEKKAKRLLNHKRVTKDWLNILYNNKSEYDWVEIL